MRLRRVFACAVLASALGFGVVAVHAQSSSNTGISFGAIDAANVVGFVGVNQGATAGSCSGGSASSSTARGPCEGGGGTWTAARAASVTGIYELGALPAVGLAVCIVIALAFAGYVLVRRLFMRAQRA